MGMQKNFGKINKQFGHMLSMTITSHTPVGEQEFDLQNVKSD
jgi:hypothetical protein